jgi:hypothetical protein
MKDEEAQELIRMVRSAVAPKEISGETLEFWKSQLGPLDAALAIKAVVAGVREWRYFPAWSQFYEIYQAERRRLAVEIAQAENQEATAPIAPADEWVWVWSWARFQRDPKEDRAFPQQAPYADPVMNQKEYQALRAEWMDAGCPKASTPLPSEALA